MLRRMLDATVPGRRRRGSQETRSKDSCKKDMEGVRLNLKTYWTGQRERTIFITISATEYDAEQEWSCVGRTIKKVRGQITRQATDRPPSVQLKIHLSVPVIIC